AAMRLFDQPITVAIRPCIRATYNAKKMSHQQLRIARVVGTIKADEGRIRRQSLQFQRERMHQARKGRFPHAAGSAEQRMQPAWWVKHRRLRLLNGYFSPIVMPDQRLKIRHDAWQSRS